MNTFSSTRVLYRWESGGTGTLSKSFKSWDLKLGGLVPVPLPLTTCSGFSPKGSPRSSALYFGA